MNSAAEQTSGRGGRAAWLIVGAVALVVALVAGTMWLTNRIEDAEVPTSPAVAASTSPSGEATIATVPDDAVEPSAPAEDATGPASTPSTGPDGRLVAPPVPLDEPVQPAADLVVSVEDVVATQGEAVLPGEVGGPALRADVTIRNDGASPVDLTSAVVNLYTGSDRVPAVGLTGSEGSTFPTAVAPGEDVTGTYVFTVAEDDREQVVVEVDLGGGATIALFAGEAPGTASG